MKLPLLQAMLLVIGGAAAIQWQHDFAYNVIWSFDCEFYDNDLGIESSTADQCGPLCSSIRYISVFFHIHDCIDSN